MWRIVFWVGGFFGVWHSGGDFLGDLPDQINEPECISNIVCAVHVHVVFLEWLDIVALWDTVKMRE